MQEVSGSTPLSSTMAAASSPEAAVSIWGSPVSARDQPCRLSPMHERRLRPATDIDLWSGYAATQNVWEGSHLIRWTWIVGLGLPAMVLAAVSSAKAVPLERPVSGPKLLCFKYSTFSLLEGERVTDFSGGLEAMSLTIEGPSGVYRVDESEIFGPAKGVLRRMSANETTSVYRVIGKRQRYAVYGPTSFSDSKDQLVIWLSGPALTGKIKDAAIYRRFNVRDTDTVKCEQKFTYGWGF